jgi:hypothetical protein
VRDTQQSRHETDTEVIPSVGSGEGLARTQELPAVEDATVEAPAPTSAPPSPPRPVVVTPARPSQARQVAPPSPAPGLQSDRTASSVSWEPTAPRPPRNPTAPSASRSLTHSSAPSPTRTPGSDGTRWRIAFVALLAALVIGGVAGVAVRGLGGSGAAGSGAGAAAGAGPTVSATISSLDPSGGSGFRSDGGTTWRTQTYQSANFGNLKSGVGLLLDVGAPRAVSAVKFQVVGGPVAVELRAGDERTASPGGYSRITGTGAASGGTTFIVKGGAKHRYWLIWVTRLAPQDGGYRAVISQPVVTGAAR